MAQLLFIGKPLPDHELIEDLTRCGYTITLAQQIGADPRAGASREILLIVILDAGGMLARAAQQQHRPGVPWLAWNRTDDQTQTLLAYAAGASAVLPHTLTAAVLRQTIATIRGPQPAPAASIRQLTTPQHRYRRGALIDLPPDTLLDITRGVVAQIMLHTDGSEALLGLAGPGQLLIAHPDDDCAIQLIAHTDVHATARPWGESADAALAERLRGRIRLMEAWSAMLARPHLDQRILGLLGLLAEQFGAPHHDGTLIDVRLTHAQLATAIGATRSTITRILGDLRSRGDLTTIGAGERERFCLRRWAPDHHTHAPPSGAHMVRIATAPPVRSDTTGAAAARYAPTDH
jgi:CRP-like cAMP-binding protein